MTPRVSAHSVPRRGTAPVLIDPSSSSLIRELGSQPCTGAHLERSAHGLRQATEWVMVPV